MSEQWERAAERLSIVTRYPRHQWLDVCREAWKFGLTEDETVTFGCSSEDPYWMQVALSALPAFGLAIDRESARD